MGIRETAMGKRVTLPWHEKLTDDQNDDLDTLAEMVNNGEVSASVAYSAWNEHHPGICGGTTFIRYLRHRRDGEL